MQHEPAELLSEPFGCAGSLAAGGLAATALSVEITTPERLVTIEREWRDLVGRALAANAFLEPAVIAAAAGAGATTIHTLLVWSGPTRLIGVWALAQQRAFSLLPARILKTPIHDHAFLGTPVLDREAAAEALSGLLDAIASEPALPKIVTIGSLDAAGPVAAIFAEVLAQRGLPSVRLETRLRPALLKTEAGSGASPVSASRAKGLRKRRKRLSLLGVVDYTRHEGAVDLGLAVEEFLTLEASGWKGRRSARGRAILRAPSVTSFFRSAIAALAVRHQIRITALRLDGRAVAMQVTLRSGATAFAWKSAYDEELRACAPGLLLHLEVTEGFLADPELSAVDSCNHHDTGHMAEFWAGRRAVSDLIIDVRPRRTVLFELISGVEAARRRLLEAARYGRSLLRAARHMVFPVLAAGKLGGGEP